MTKTKSRSRVMSYIVGLSLGLVVTCPIYCIVAPYYGVLVQLAVSVILGEIFYRWG